MHSSYSTTEKSFRIIAFLFSSIVVITQLVLMMQGAAENGEVFIRLIRFFSFMTILTNILVALTYIVPLSLLSSKWGRFFANPKAQSAVLVYIIIVCLGYHFLLANIWKPEGLQYWVDKALHYFVPFIYIIFYLIFVRKGTLAYKTIFRWLVYPFVYLVYAITRGYITNDYPYPFLDLGKHDASKVLTVVAALFLGYVIVSLVVVVFDRSFAKRD